MFTYLAHEILQEKLYQSCSGLPLIMIIVHTNKNLVIKNYQGIKPTKILN